METDEKDGKPQELYEFVCHACGTKDSDEWIIGDPFEPYVLCTDCKDRWRELLMDSMKKIFEDPNATS